MSHNEPKDPVGLLDVSAPTGNLTKLAELAREAYERKDVKVCLDLTRAMLLIDPDNADAQWMRSSIQSEMHRDLESARAFLRQAHSKEDPGKQAEPATPAVVADEPAPLTESFPSTHPPLAAWWRKPATRWLAVASLLAVFAVVTAVSFPLFGTKPNPVPAPAPPSSELDKPEPIVTITEEQPASLLGATKVDNVAPSPSTPKPAPAPAAAEPAPRPAAKAPDPLPVIPVARGTLAISSLTSVDIYKDDALLGSVPASLDLPAGVHTLEYRHGTLRQSVTHTINGNETTRAIITFDMTVQINSKPWADVFIDGTNRKTLGQTPLSGVRVPIGSVLIFENPNFQAKRYRVRGNETGIQIVFP